jgi:muconolactone delta-isomerase
MKFLVEWHLDVGKPSPEVIKAVAETPNYAQKLKSDGKLECRHHLIGKHGGAWIYDVKSNEELDLLLAMSPVYNYAHYEVLPPADMSDPARVLGKGNK